MEISRNAINPELRANLIEYCYTVIGCMHHVHDGLGPGLPEYIYQEALFKTLKNEGFPGTIKEYIHHPMFDGMELESFVKMDMIVPMSDGNIIIECKSIAEISDKERYQTFGYLRATGFPIAILVNFGTWPKAQIERYYFDTSTQTIHAF